jgi:hypothetical protein
MLKSSNHGKQKNDPSPCRNIRFGCSQLPTFFCLSAEKSTSGEVAVRDER